VIVAADMSAAVAFSPDSSRILVVGDLYSGTHGNNDIDLIDLETRRVVPIGFEGPIMGYAFSPNQPTLAVLLPDVKKLVRLNLELLEAESWDIGGLAQRLKYLPTAQVFMVDYRLRRGKITFVGDLGTDVYWIAARFFDN